MLKSDTVTPEQKDRSLPPSIASFKDLANKFPDAILLNPSPESEYSIPLPTGGLLLLDQSISSTFPGKKRIDFSFALPCQQEPTRPSVWGKHRPQPYPSDWPQKNSQFELSWIKNGGYQKLFDFFSSVDFSAQHQALTDQRQRATEAASLLTDPSLCQSSDQVFDWGRHYLFTRTKPSRRQSYDGLQISFSPSGVVTVQKGVYNPKTDNFSRVYFLSHGRFAPHRPASEMAIWVRQEVNAHSEASPVLKNLLPTTPSGAFQTKT